MLKIRDYLLYKKDKSVAFLGCGKSMRNVYFLHDCYGINANMDTNSITIHGKSEKLIDEEFSRLEELSKDIPTMYDKILIKNN